MMRRPGEDRWRPAGRGTAGAATGIVGAKCWQSYTAAVLMFQLLQSLLTDGTQALPPVSPSTTELMD